MADITDMLAMFLAITTLTLAVTAAVVIITLAVVVVIDFAQSVRTYRHNRKR